ncbi:hypothetical protein C0J52_15891 [Blattella germanica]|nr:hypothetical protein C0J52_15891 [Blattella germanica]
MNKESDTEWRSIPCLAPATSSAKSFLLSIKNNKWTDERNKSNTNLIKSELQVAMPYSCSIFYEFAKNDIKLLTEANSVAKYLCFAAVAAFPVLISTSPDPHNLHPLEDSSLSWCFGCFHTSSTWVFLVFFHLLDSIGIFFSTIAVTPFSRDVQTISNLSSLFDQLPTLRSSFVVLSPHSVLDVLILFHFFLGSPYSRDNIL